MPAPDSKPSPLPKGDKSSKNPDASQSAQNAGAEPHLANTVLHNKTVEENEARPAVSPDKSIPEIAGYELLEELGRGAMGVVVKARQLSPERFVALKMIRSTLATHDEEVRFRNEAEAIAQMRHRNIVQIYDYAITDGHPYFSMELLDGGSLSARIRMQQWSAEGAALLIEKLARALHHAHELGIIHRDIKPDNVLFSQDGEPQLTDFGLAHRDACNYLQTIPGTQMGTPPYMSPEQARGESDRVDARSDVWSLGTVLYELLTGKRAFLGEKPVEIIERVLNEDPASPATVRRGLDKDIVTICMKCLSKDPKGRYESAQALANDLRAYLELRPIAARPASVMIHARKWMQRRPLMAVSIGAFLVAVVAVGYGLWFHDAYRAKHVQYFGNMNTRWGIPVGMHELTLADVRRRGYGFEFTRYGRRNPPHLVRTVNSDGKPLDGFMRTWFEGVLTENAEFNWSQTSYIYDPLGRLLEERATNSESIQVYSFLYFYDPGNDDPTPHEVTGKYFKGDGGDLDPTLITFRRNDEGFDTEIQFATLG